MRSAWWLVPAAVVGGALWGISFYLAGWEPSIWVIGAVSVVIVMWVFGPKAASAVGLAILAAIVLRRERKAGYDQREAERARDALDQVQRGTRARNDLDLSDERLRDDDGYRRD